ncbi:BT1 family-domain-containing protein [Scenedesmus sp. NREL 46B-D3]|nr:BT1 family-domain-containing protein [Scenedesmus sp. NREL 46B-D3]
MRRCCHSCRACSSTAGRAGRRLSSRCCGACTCAAADKARAGGNCPSVFCAGHSAPVQPGHHLFEKDDLHMEPTQMAIADTIAGLPWAVKPLYGFITDSFPIRGMRRRPYLIIAGLVGSASWLCLAAFASTIPATVACITAAAAATAFSDVVADSIVVELARVSPGATEGALQSLCWGAHAFGRVITAYLSGWLVDRAGVRFVFVVTATFPLVVCLSSCLICEKKLAAAAAAAAHHADAAADAKAHGSSTPAFNAAAAAEEEALACGGGVVCSPSWSRKAAGRASSPSIPEDGDLEPSSVNKGLGSGSGNGNLHTTEISPASPLSLAGAYDIVLRQQQQQHRHDSSRIPNSLSRTAGAALPAAADVCWEDDAAGQQHDGQDSEHKRLPAGGVYHQLSFGVWGEEMVRKVESDGRSSFELSPRFNTSMQEQQQQQRRLLHQSSFGFGLPPMPAGVVGASTPGHSRSNSGISDAAGKAKAASREVQQQWWQQALSSMIHSLSLFWNAVKQPHMLRPVMFLFLWQVRCACCCRTHAVGSACGNARFLYLLGHVILRQDVSSFPAAGRAEGALEACLRWPCGGVCVRRQGWAVVLPSPNECMPC